MFSCPDGVKDPADLHAADPAAFVLRLQNAIESSTELQFCPAKPAASQTPDAPKTVRELEAYQPFPTDALPIPLGEYVQQGAPALGCDAAYLPLRTLGLVAV